MYGKWRTKKWASIKEREGRFKYNMDNFGLELEEMQSRVKILQVRNKAKPNLRHCFNL